MTSNSRKRPRPSPAKKHKPKLPSETEAQACSHALSEMLRAADAAYQERRGKYEDFLEANKHRPSLERSIAWLEFVAANVENYRDYEALVYLASQGRDVDHLIEVAVENWKEDERGTIDASLRGTPIDVPATCRHLHQSDSPIKAIRHRECFGIFTAVFLVWTSVTRVIARRNHASYR